MLRAEFLDAMTFGDVCLLDLFTENVRDIQVTKMHDSINNCLPVKEQKETFVQEMFNAIAGRYDLMNSLMSFGRDKAWRKFTIRCADLKPGGHGLDVCCGTGCLPLNWHELPVVTEG